MIKISKDLTNIPVSLNPDFDSLTGGDKRKAKTTHQRRIELIKAKKYIHDSKYDSRYKLDDIKKRLVEKYNSKCAYCEQWVESSHVEHYRPKSEYYWLAFSWDNLLNVCPKCNESKGDRFDFCGTKITFQKNNKNIVNINNLSTVYDLIEKPKLINPEREDPYPLLSFTETGSISSSDSRMQYTIELCKLDRNILVAERKKILDDFIKYLDVEIALTGNKQKLREAISVLYRGYQTKTRDITSTFISFRRYHLDHKTIEGIIKSKLI